MLPVSALTSLEYCRRKFYLQYVLQAKVPIPKEVLIKGTVRHKAEELAIATQEEIVRGCRLAQIGDILIALKERYARSAKEAVRIHMQELSGSGTDVDAFSERMEEQLQESARIRAEQIIRFATAHRLEGDLLWERLQPKIRTEIRMQSPTLKLRGIIDVIEEYDDHSVVVELKTGSAPVAGVWPGHRIQIAAYMMLLNANDKSMRVRKGMVRYLDSRIERPVILNPFMEMEIHTMIQSCSSLLACKDAPEHTSERRRCENCQYKEICFDNAQMSHLMEARWNDAPRVRIDTKESSQKTLPEEGTKEDRNGDLRSFF